MEQSKYDVFISYSRKDYVDEHKNIIPDNEVSKIKKALIEAGITYWFDENSIYSGDKFTETIVNNIENSHIFLFLSTKNACDSTWTSKEIACADELGKCIIPVRIDKAPYNKKVMFRIADLIYIDYCKNPQKGLAELIDTIKTRLNQLKSSTSYDNTIISADRVSDLKGFHHFDTLRAHIMNKQTLRVQYMSYRASHPKEFLFFPYLLKEFRLRWYLVGSTPNSKELSNLALDRIVSFEIDNSIPYCDSGIIDISHYYDDVIGVSKNKKQEPDDVVFGVSKNRYRYIETKPLHSSQMVIRKTPDGGCLFNIHVVINLELFSVLMSFGSDLIVLSPPKVIRYMQREFRKAIHMYEDETMKIESE